MQSHVIDTNILLRILTEDDPEQTARSEELLRKAGNGELTLFVSTVCLAEIAWTLESFYGLSKKDIATKLIAILNTEGLKFSRRRVLIDAIMRLGEYEVDFADAYHAAIADAEGIDVYSYDRDYDEFSDITRREP